MFAEQELLDAHARGDGRALVDLYLTVGELKEGSNPDAACFHFTQACVFAPETAHPAASEIRRRLIGHGREE